MDEAAHLYAGYQHWTAHDFGVNPEHPPLVKLVAALPLLGMNMQQPHPPNPIFLAEEYIGGDQLLGMNGGDALLQRARTAVIVFPLLLGASVFLAGSEMFGITAGLLGLTIFCFEPTILAHGALITTDMGVTAMVFVTVWTFWRYVQRPGWLRLLLFAVASGLALVSKMSGIIVLPIVLVLGVLEAFPWSRRRALQIFGGVAVAALAGYLMIWAFYGFRYAARPPGPLAMAPPLPAFAAMLPSNAETGLVMLLARFHLLPEAYLYGWAKLPIDQMSHPASLFGQVYLTRVPCIFQLRFWSRRRSRCCCWWACRLCCCCAAVSYIGDSSFSSWCRRCSLCW
ncbi:MAG: glycosyltransferase family 39 protein [Terriglobus roseus]|nr:glycosyltransferase family 39 protein [Terriglobus roseus]